ncbi:hypothetical protein [Streptacidiphilus sp. MAP5-3]|uniref:hypothetical protein n=1 Tax=unclassified Streptacidiphilus TaxID=2643834 RepID=UPI003517D095
MMRVQCDQVRAVQLADGWHAVERGTFRFDSVQFASDAPAEKDDAVVEWPAAFVFGTPDGEAFAGPLSSLLAVSYQVPDKPRPPAHEDLARRLNGQVLTVAGTSTVRFTHADHEFDVWLDAGTWRYVESAQRTTTTAVDTYLPEPDVPALVSQMMADLKSTWGLGRPPGSRDGRDHDTSPTTGPVRPVP